MPQLADRERIAELVQAGRTADALFAIETLVEAVFCEPLNTAEVFADAFLDQACQAIGAAALADLPAYSKGVSRGAPVFIASMLQRSGGHTAVLADIARLLGQGATILLTGVAGPTRLDQIAHLLRGIEPLQVEHAPRGNRAAKLNWLQSRLRGLQPWAVWLVNHHQDSVAVAAVQPEQGYVLKYLHHGDHHLCLGVTLPFGEHYDPHAMGLRNCGEVLHRTDGLYLPMALTAPTSAQRFNRDGPLVTCTAAGSNKVEHDYQPAYADVVPALLAGTGGTHIHIGPLSRTYRLRISRGLAKRGLSEQQFRYIPFVPDVNRALRELGVDLYLSSFPYAGARTLVEVMAAGIPIAAHDHSGSRFLSAMDMLPSSSCVWSQPRELIEFVQSSNRVALEERGRQALLHYQRFHTAEAMRAALTDPGQALQPPASAYEHRPDHLAQALRRARQVTLKGVASRWLRRWMRRLRASLS